MIVNDLSFLTEDCYKELEKGITQASAIILYNLTHDRLTRILLRELAEARNWYLTPEKESA